ncbi:MAG: methyl-accepting chemotaxis protein [Prolixibacteraceae bacterium]|nr:methyl-accepting chemotaxis protein [Prolixibacteraceae bacterium]
MKKMSYKAKIIMALLLITGTVLTGSLTFYFLKFKKVVFADATKMVDAYVSENANKIGAEFSTDMGVCRAIAYSISASQAFHNEDQWDTYIAFLKEADLRSEGYLNVWASFELSSFRKGYTKPYGRRVLNAYTMNGEQLINDYFKNLEGDDPGSSYLLMKTHKKEGVIEPYLFSLSGKKEDEQLVTSICVPILKGNQYIGLAGVDIGLERYQQLTDNVKPYTDSYSFLVAYDGTIITHPDKALINQKISEVFNEEAYQIDLLSSIQKGDPFAFTTQKGKKEYYAFAPINIGQSETPWALATVTPQKTIFRKAQNILYQTMLVGILGFIVMGFIVWLIVTRLVNTFKQFTLFANKVNKGILTEKLDIHRNDELGELARALTNMGNSLRDIVNQIKVSSLNISEASELLNRNSQSISFAASKQAAEVEEISSALEQMVMLIDQNATNSKETEEIALSSKDGIMEGSKASLKATQSIREITTKNHLISDIAFQTNILALNAAVEAARAGEHGRGFSVVAAEVRKLAERSKEAANEINQLSEIILTDSTNAQNKLLEVIPEIEKTTNLVQEIATSSKEQSDGVNQINSSIHQLNDISQDNASSAESLAASAEELSAQAYQLEELISKFKT